MSRWRPVTSGADLAQVLAGDAARRSLEAFDLTARLVADDVVDVFQLHFYEPSVVLPGVLDLLRERLGPDVAIEAWEVGVAWPGADFTEQAQVTEMLRLVALLLREDVRRIVYLPVAYTPSPRPQVFRGLVLEDGTLLAAGRVWLRLAEALQELTGPPVALTGAVSGVAWASDTGQSAIVWSTEAPVVLPDGLATAVVDTSGNEVDPAAPIGAEPVVVVGSADLDLAQRLRDLE